jgi:signal recognition particle subunit SRP72
MALIESQSSPEVPNHQYEKSYCLYRLNKESEAESILKQLQENVDVDQRGVMHLEAQIVGFLLISWA